MFDVLAWHRGLQAVGVEVRRFEPMDETLEIDCGDVRVEIIPEAHGHFSVHRYASLDLINAWCMRRTVAEACITIARWVAHATMLSYKAASQRAGADRQRLLRWSGRRDDRQPRAPESSTARDVEQGHCCDPAAGRDRDGPGLPIDRPARPLAGPAISS